MKPKARLGTVEVTADGEGLVSHAGAVLLVELADRVGLTGGLSAALASTRERRSAHDPGRVLRDVAVMLADGGDCVTDLDALRGQELLFGPVASETTTHRTLKAVDAAVLAGVRSARAGAREGVGRGSPPGHDHPRYRRDLADRALREGPGHGELQARVRVSPVGLLAGRDR